MNKTNKVRKGEVRIYEGKTYVAIPEIKDIFQMKDSRNIKSSCQIPIKRNSVSRDIIM